MDLVTISENILRDCLGAKAGEEVYIVTDDTRVPIAQALYEGAKNLGCEAMMTVMKERELNGQEPPKAVAAAMKAADIVICPTAKSLTHTNARIQAVAEGTRVATMPGITEEMFSQGAMTADYSAVAALTAKITDLLTECRTARIEKDGCVLTLKLDGRKGVPSPGVYKEAGQSGNLPSGEAYIAPLEDGVDGEIACAEEHNQAHALVLQLMDALLEPWQDETLRKGHGRTVRQPGYQDIVPFLRRETGYLFLRQPI